MLHHKLNMKTAFPETGKECIFNM